MISMKEEKIMLDLEGLKRSKLSSLEITSDLNNALIEIFVQNIKKKNPKIRKGELVKELRRVLLLDRRDYEI